MPERAKIIRDFMQTTDWRAAQIAPLAGDASLRKYFRVGPNSKGIPAVLMDADPALGNDTSPFVTITEYLRSIDLSAPQLYAQDAQNGLLLLEDLGDDLFARVTADQPGLELPLYQAATDVLLHLHNQPAMELAPYDTPVMTEMAALPYAWYLLGMPHPGDPDREIAFRASFSHLLDTYVPKPAVLIQRDYHAENLLWLPNRNGVHRVGLLDYQDALLGHPAYDLVSLLKDARRDVTPDIEAQMIERYCLNAGIDPEQFQHAYDVLGLQRNLRILGVFARLSLHYGKASYVDLIPRVWGFISDSLKRPACAPIADQVLADLPTPTPEILNRLVNLCGTIPTR